MTSIPDFLISPLPEFAEEYESRREHGESVLLESRLAVVGLARNCGQRLHGNLLRMSAISGLAGDCRVLILENDSTDDTKQVAESYAANSKGRAEAITRDLGRKHRPNEFAGPRTNELAEYRSECQDWVRRSGDFDYVAVIDWDAWGGWIHDGVMTGFSYLATEADAFGFASVSLTEHPSLSFSPSDQKVTVRPNWLHYDCWALRTNSYWDDYSSGYGGWKHQYLPPVGSPPVRVCSAFGGFCIYRAADYLDGVYSGEDCEHVCFHRSIQEKTQKGLYLNPSQRTIMQWIEHAKHDDDSSQPVQV